MGIGNPYTGVKFTNEAVRTNSAELAVYTYSHSDRRDLDFGVVKCTPDRL